jgi:hypothetical protein
MLISRTIVFAIPGQAAGDLVYFDGADWVPLPIGAAGQAVVSNGGPAPVWGTPSGLPIRTSGTLNATGTIQLTLPNLMSGFTGYRVVEINLALEETGPAAEESVYLRATIDAAATEIDLVVSTSGGGGIYDAVTGLTYAISGSDLVIDVPLLVGTLVNYAASIKEG